MVVINSSNSNGNTYILTDTTHYANDSELNLSIIFRKPKSEENIYRVEVRRRSDDRQGWFIYLNETEMDELVLAYLILKSEAQK